MKKKYSKFVIYVLTWIALFIGNVVSGQTFSDNATNYGVSWATGSNQGTGFGVWLLSAGASSGSFIGNPANNGMGTSGIGTTSFGMFATGSAYFNAYRSIINGIQVGDTFSFYWAINWDAGGGTKGFDLRSGVETIFNINIGNSATISTTNGPANTNYGTAPMLVTITRTSANQYSFSMTSRSGGATYTTTINNSATIDGFNFYIGNQNSGSGERNMYVNGFSITKPITIANGNWNNTSTWFNNTIPPSGASVTIDHNVTVNSDITLRSMVINTGKTLTASDSTPRTLTISNGGFITNNGTFTRGTGTVSYAGAGILNGSSAITFNNLTVNTGSLTLTTVPTIDGTLTINGGNLSSAPIYSSNSTLLYNITYNRFNEWNATGIGTIGTTAGYPNNVTINSGTFTLLNSDAGTARAMNGSLTVASNATFATGTLNALLTIGGNIVNNGTITMSLNNSRIKCANFNNSSGANVTLSSVIGGDLEVTGDIIDNGTFNSNNRAIFFTGSAIQNISGSGVFNIDYVVSNKSGGQIQLQSNLLCEGPNAGNAMDLSSSSDILDLNGYTLTLGRANVSSGITGNGSIRGGGNSSLILLGDGNMGILNIDITTPGTTNVLNNLTLNRTNTGIVTLGNPLIINNALSLTSGTLNMQSNALSGTALTTSGTGKLQTQNTSPTPIPSGRSWSFEVEMNANSNQTVPQGNYATLRLNTGGIKNIADNSAIAGDFVVSSSATATVGTTIFFNGSTPQSIAGLAYNNIEFSGTGVKTFTSNASVGSTSAVTFTSTPGTIDFDGASNNLIFQLKSVDGGTARIGNTTGWTLTGNVTVERYIPVTANRRAWRLLTAPLKGITNNKIRTNWQGVNNEGLLLFSPANYQGQAMTGYTTGGSMPNIWKYNSTNNTWEFIPNLTNENLFTDTINNGFLVFATGPSNSTNIVSGAATTTLKPQGQLITGNVAHSLTADRYHLIGNPYASPLNTVTMTQANPDTKVFMVDPSIGSVGGYVTYDGTNWAPSAPSASDAYIQSGQGFFVRSASATSFTISESHKVTGNSNTWFVRNATETTSDKIRLLLYKQIDSQWQLADGILAVNSAAGNNDVDATDTGKMTNFNENIGFRNGTSTLAIEYRGLPTTGTVQPMRLTATTVQPYQIRVKTENYSNSTLQPYLEDTQLGTLTLIPTDGSEVVVSFTGVASTTSNPDNRFRIVYPTTLSSDDPTALLVGVYPNPVEDKMFTVVLPEASVEASYTLTNLIGQQVQQGKLDAIQSSVSVSSLQGGIYLLQVLQSGKTFTTKLIIK